MAVGKGVRFRCSARSVPGPDSIQENRLFHVHCDGFSCPTGWATRPARASPAPCAGCCLRAVPADCRHEPGPGPVIRHAQGSGLADALFLVLAMDEAACAFRRIETGVETPAIGDANVPTGFRGRSAWVSGVVAMDPLALSCRYGRIRRGIAPQLQWREEIVGVISVS